MADADADAEVFLPRKGNAFGAVLANSVDAGQWCLNQLKGAGLNIELKKPLDASSNVLVQQIVQQEVAMKARAEGEWMNVYEGDDIRYLKWESFKKMKGFRLFFIEAGDINSFHFNSAEWQHGAGDGGVGGLKRVSKRRLESEDDKIMWNADSLYIMPFDLIPALDVGPTLKQTGGCDRHLRKNNIELIGRAVGYTIDALYDEDERNKWEDHGSPPPALQEVIINAAILQRSAILPTVRKTARNTTLEQTCRDPSLLAPASQVVFHAVSPKCIEHGRALFERALHRHVKADHSGDAKNEMLVELFPQDPTTLTRWCEWAKKKGGDILERVQFLSSAYGWFKEGEEESYQMPVLTSFSLAHLHDVEGQTAEKRCDEHPHIATDVPTVISDCVASEYHYLTAKDGFPENLARPNLFDGDTGDTGTFHAERGGRGTVSLKITSRVYRKLAYETTRKICFHESREIYFRHVHGV